MRLKMTPEIQNADSILIGPAPFVSVVLWQVGFISY
jgi:hypothetical protein